jgi:hypothetical protein
LVLESADCDELCCPITVSGIHSGGAQVSLKNEYFSATKTFLEHYATRMPGSGGDGGAIPGRGGDFLPTSMDVGEAAPRTFKVGYNIKPEPRIVAWHLVHPAEVRLLVKGTHAASQYTGIADDEWFEAYFLPWNQGCTARLKIPRATSVNAFFTAEMNGCSFVVGGTEFEPWTAHVNVGDIRNNAQREQRWQEMVKATATGARFTNMAALRKWGVPTGAPGGPAPPSRFTSVAQNAPVYEPSAAEDSTAVAAMKDELKGVNKKITGAAPITDLKVSLMGLRDGSGRWSFFYQRNLFVQAIDVKRRLGRAGGLIKLLGMDKRKTESLSRYMLIKGSEYVSFWPDGSGRVVVPATGPADSDLDLGGLF